MSWRYNDVQDFQTAVNRYVQSSEAVSRFNAGYASHDIWKFANVFTVTGNKEQSYNLMPRFETVVTNLPEDISCGADIPLVGDSNPDYSVYWTPFGKRIAIRACRMECGDRDLSDYLGNKEYAAGHGFAKIQESVFWYGRSHQPGLTNMPGFTITDLAADTNYGLAGGGLDTKDPITVANFFSYITQGIDDPVIVHGPAFAELIGWRPYGTGDNCSAVWSCVLDHLGMRFGGNASDRFISVDSFDRVTGVNPNAPTDTNTMVMVIDRDQLRLGRGREINRTKARILNDDEVQTVREGIMTTPQILKQSSVRAYVGMVDQANIDEVVGARYGDEDAPSLTVPTPIL